jgi:hypothetical protein
MLVAAENILTVKANTSIGLSCLPCWPALPTLLACPAYLVGLPALFLYFVPATSALIEVDFLRTNMP